MAATRHGDGNNDRRIGTLNPATFPEELMALIVPPGTNPQRPVKPARSGDPASLRPGDDADIRGFGDRRVAPRIAVGKERRDQPAGPGMARPQSAEMPDDRSAGEIEGAQGMRPP